MQTQAAQEHQTTSECQANADQMSDECLANVERTEVTPLGQMSPNDIVNLANILLDIDALHQAGHMEPVTFGAIVNLVANTMLKGTGGYLCLNRMQTECPLNAH